MTNKLTYHLLPTEDASPIGFIGNSALLLIDNTKKEVKVDGVPNINFQHIYLTSHAPINRDNYFICSGRVQKALKVDAEYIYGNDFTEPRNLCKRIEFTTDPKLIADGVPRIDGDTKAKVVGESDSKWWNNSYEVNFLTEFCNHYNQKGDQKVDVEKLIFDLLNKHLPKDTKWTIEVERGVQNAIKEALQSNAGGFSLPTAIELRNSNILMLPLGECEIIIEAIKSLTSQPKGEMVIECDTETKTLIFK